MSQYSEMMGSFIRTGNYPLEANFIFPDEASLIEFYSDELRKTILHKGLLKLVEKDEEGNLALYWVTKKKTNDELEFLKLISGNDIDSIFEQLESLEERLSLEIDDRREADNTIFGTDDPSIIPEDLNSILDLANAITELREDLADLRSDMEDADAELKAELKATVGTEEDDIISYLETLDYTNLTKISEALHHFLNTIDDEDHSINTLPELKEFLRGFEYTHNLYQCFVDFWNAIEGTPTPNTQFRTLRGIQDFVEALASVVKNRCDNLQTELDLTQVGVGLSGDGAYNADQETYYLKDATSVMNALKILDSLINEAINNCNMIGGETDSVKINIIKEKDKTTIYADVKLSSEKGNDIQCKNDGLYHNVDTEYENGILTVRVNGEVRQQHVLGLSMIVESAKYDPSLESIVIVFKLQSGDTQEVVIPVAALIAEWEVDNSRSEKVVELERVRITGAGADKLSADVRLSKNPRNILVKDGNTLLVEGVASNITFDGDITVESKLNELVAKDSDLQNQINQTNADLAAEKERATNAETSLLNSLTQEIHDRETSEQDIRNLANLLEARVSTNESNISDLQTKSQDLDTKISDEISRALAEEHRLEDLISAELTRAEAAESTLQDNLDKAIEAEANRAKLAEQDLRNDLNIIDGRVSTNESNISKLQEDLVNESERAKQAEQSLLTGLIEEAHTREVTDQDLQNKIDGLDARVSTNEGNISSLTDRTTALETNLTLEIHDRENSELEIKNDLSNLGRRVTNNEANITKLSDELTTESNRARLKEQEISDNLVEESHRREVCDLDLQNQIDALNTRTTTNEGDISDLKGRTETLEVDLKLEIHNRETSEQDIRNEASKLTTRVETNEGNIADLLNRTTTLESGLVNESNRAASVEQDLQNQINNTNSRVDANDAKTQGLQDGLILVNEKLTQEIADRIAEETRATLVEQDLLNLINTTNSNVSTNADNISKLDEGLKAEIERAKAAEKAIIDSEHTYNNTQTIAFDKNGNVVSANVKIAGGDTNIIKVNEETSGIYATVDIGYNAIENKIWLITSAGTTQEVQLSEGNVIDDITYDVNEKALILTYTANGILKQTKFPVADLFNDWIVKNPAEGSAIELHKEYNVKDPNSNDTPDVLSARLIILDDETNAARIVGNGLYVSNKETVANTKAIEDLKSKQSDLENNLNSEVERAKGVEQELKDSITAETNRAILVEQGLQNSLDTANSTLSLVADRLAQTETTVSNIDTNLQLETSRAIAKEELLNQAIELNTSKISDLDSYTKLELAKKLESVQLVKNDDLSYTILVDGISIGVINIPKDQFLSDVTLNGNVLHFVFTTKDGVKTLDIDFTEILQEALSQTIGDVSNIQTLLNETVSKLNDEIIRATHREDLLEKSINDVLNQANSNSSSIEKINDEISKIKLKDVELDSTLSQLSDKITTVETNIKENVNAQLTNISDKLEAEITRSTNKDNELAQGLADANTAINNESVRAQAKETALETSITTNNLVITERASKIESDLDTFKSSTSISLEKVNDAISDIKLKDVEQDAKLNQLDEKITSVETGLKETINSQYSQLDDKITSVESNIKENINSLLNNLSDKLEAEIIRSTNKDVEHTNSLNSLTSDLASEVSRATAQEGILKNLIDTNNQILTEKTTNLDNNLSNLKAEVNASLAKKIEKVELLNPTDLTYSILVDGSSIGTIRIPEDQYFISAELIGNVIRLMYKVNSETIVKDIDLSDILRDAVSGANSDINNVRSRLETLLDQINAEIIRATNKEIEIENALLREIDRAKDEELDILDEVHHLTDRFEHHTNDYDNPHRVTKDQVGLGNVDNTADKDKPVSDATQHALDGKADKIHYHTKADILDLDDVEMPVIAKGFVTTLLELPEGPENGDKYVLRSYSGSDNYAYELLEWSALAQGWKQKIIPIGGLTCIIDENVWKLNSTGPERVLDASDYKYFYNKIYDETKNLIEDIDWEEDDTNDTNGQIRLKITYKKSYGDPDPESQIESEVTNPYQAKAVKYIDIDKARFLSSAYSRPATLQDIDKGYAATIGEPMLILVFTTGDYVAIRLNELMNIYDPVDTPSIDMEVTDWTGNKDNSYKIQADVKIAATKGQDNAISIHINSTNGDQGIYATLHTQTTNSIALNPATGTGQKYLTADLKIDNALNDVNDVYLSISANGLSAKLVIGDYD